MGGMVCRWDGVRWDGVWVGWCVGGMVIVYGCERNGMLVQGN